jgi:hypothetical protein
VDARVHLVRGQGAGLALGLGGRARVLAQAGGPLAVGGLPPVEEEAVVRGPEAQAGVGPLVVVDDLQGLLDAGGRGGADAAAVVAVVTVVGAVRDPAVGIPGVKGWCPCVNTLDKSNQIKEQRGYLSETMASVSSK